MNKTLFDKIWEMHVVNEIDEYSVIYIDKHFIHEVTSPQAFLELKERGIPIFRKDQIIATTDHNVPTLNQNLPIKEYLSKKQIDTLYENCKENNITLYGLNHKYQGIVHVIGAELGITMPGMTIVCGDSHTSTHGAFGSIAFGIGTSQVASVLATQCVIQKKPMQMRININGTLKKGVSAKDVILYIISQIGSDGGTGYFVEYHGDVFLKMSMEERMTVCNMSIEMGSRGGLINSDNVTFKYLENRLFSPKKDKLDNLISFWKTLYTDSKASFDKEYYFNAEDIPVMITYGTNPGMGIPINGNIPLIEDIDVKQQNDFVKSLKYMGFKPGDKLLGKPINYVFIGSCTNARIEDFRIVAKIIKGNKKAENVKAYIVPGSQQVVKQIFDEGINTILDSAGFILRQPGCSACLAMNEDKIPTKEYCISTSNRNFEGRQGPGARTILASPAVAAVAAITGKITNINNYIS
ncbi:MAG: 3-isopropylmalate dehydratase large subunit [Bacteroides sp.]|nr:MAG: 3-isopropylmalate dehydratase large subunit [Bacteroides sp.]